jgi:Kef-type K+ transport system membrane component KefB
VLFFILIFLAGHYLLQWLGDFIKKLKLAEFEMSFLLVTALFFSLLAEFLSMHFILGAFAAGLFFQRRTIDKHTFEDVSNKVSGITMGFFAPVFFASIGLHLNVSALTSVPLFLLLIIFIAFFSKVAGAAVPSFIMGFTVKESLAIGTAMSARGAVELIIADIAFRAGLFSLPDPPPPIIEYMFSVVVMVAIVTTVTVPVVLRQIISRHN